MRIKHFISAIVVVYGSIAIASPASLSYQGRILKSDGTPLEYSNVSFQFQIMDPSGQCLIYQEQVSGISLVNSGGVFDVPIGAGAIQYPLGVTSILDAFNNTSTFNCGTCALSGSTYNCVDSSSNYTAALGDGRKLRVSFYDGSAWKTISPDNIIRSVPFAGYSLSAQKLGNNVAGDFLLKAGLPTCANGSFLSWDGTALSCGSVLGANGGTVSSISTGAGLTGGPITNSGTISLSVSGVTSGTYGSNNKVPVVTVDDYGRVTSATNTTISGVAPGGAAGGDLGGNYPNPTVVGLQGIAVGNTAPANDQFLKYNGTSWNPATISTSDISGLSPTLSSYLTQSAFNSAVASANCSTTQTMYWNSLSGSFQCQNISVTSGGTISALTGDVSASGSGTVVATVNSVGGSTAVNIHSAELAANAATESNAASTIVKRDAFGNFTAGTIAANLTGNVTGSASLNVLKAGDSMTGNLNHAANTGDVYTAGSGSNTVTVEGPSGSIGASYVLRFPSAQGVANQVLTNDGSGNLSWATPSTTATSYSGVLPVANGGTNSSTALTGNKIMVSTASAIVEGPALANGQLLIGSTGATPTAASLTAGSGITITPAAGSITIATTGLLASSLADGKIWVGQSGAPTAVTPSGDATMTNSGAITVAKLQGTAVSATAPSSTGQVLRWNGTSWTPNFVSMFDLRSTITGTQAFGGVGCTAGQTLTWTAATDNLSCTNIAVSSSQVTFPTQTANTFFAAPTGSTGTPAFRAIASADLPAGTLSGSGTAGYFPYYSATSTLSNSVIYQSGSNVGLGTTAPAFPLDIAASEIGFNGNLVMHQGGGNTNIFVGTGTGNTSMTGTYNSVIGNASLASNTSGTDNVAVGSGVLYWNTTGSSNSGFGDGTLKNNTTGNNNVGFGNSALLSLTTGVNNTAIGINSGYYANGASSGNVFIGYNAGPSSTATISNKLYIANAAGTPLIYGDFAAGNVGIGTTAPASKLQVSGAITNTVSTFSGVFTCGTSALDFSSSNFLRLSPSSAIAAGSCTVILNNLVAGGSYTLVVTGNAATNAITYAFSGYTFKYLPTNAATTAGKDTIYTFVYDGSTVYVTWASGY